MNFVHYELATGRIVAQGSAPDDIAHLQRQIDCGLLEVLSLGQWEETHYVADPNGTPVLTPNADMMPTISATTVPADGVTAVTIGGLPDPVSLAVAGPVAAVAEITGGSVDLTFDVSGSYTLRFTRAGFNKLEATIDATQPV